ncbi:MAG: cadherin domain-containing protein, partial [Planctomycetaceae bacterium]|nr:cadherin domain-containing protein [Planctomycetaceae bacterium]
MSVFALFARVSQTVLHRSLKDISRRPAQRRRINGAATARLQVSLEVMEQRVLLAGAEADDDHVLKPGIEIHGIPAYDPNIHGPQPVQDTAIADPPFDLDNTFFLHSNPGATKVIYLDFDGHVTNDTLGDITGWNGGQRVDSQPYDIDGDIFTFNDQELENIQRVWQQVIEDFIPFDVDVTTEEPALADLRRQDEFGSSITYIITNETDDGSIPQAFDTQITSGQVADISARIGDGPFGNTSGDYDWYKVPTVTTGQVIQVDVNAESLRSQLDTVVSIYDPAGNLVATNDNASGSADSFLNYTATTDGDYYVVVYGAGTGEQTDPLNSSTGAGAASTGFYDVRIGLDPIPDQNWGIRVVIAGDRGEWLTSSVGGIAFLNSFSSGVDVPTFVFQGGTGSVKNIAEAASHEVGHTLGLNHDGRWQFDANGNRVTSFNETYYSGHGSGETGWAPIMGVGYGKELVQWSMGEYYSGPFRNGHFEFEANNSVTFGHQQRDDDLFIITTRNGFTYRVDDHGGNRATATQLIDNGNGLLSGEGIIERNTDQDFFKFTVPQLQDYEVTGIDIIANNYEVSPNLDIAIDLYDSTGKRVAFSSPIDKLDAAMTFVLIPGETYFVRIDGVGNRNTRDGYSDYGSLGYYTLDVVYFEPIIINDQTMSVPENSPVNTSVGFVASGKAPSDAITYEILSGNAAGTFQIDDFTGEITVADNALLDFETNPQFVITVRVTDRSRAVVYQDTADITINVLDGAEKPVIAPQQFNVPENSANGTSVGVIQASDPDPQRTLTYAIIAGNTQGVFALNATTGRITVADSSKLDFETVQSFVFTVQVTNDNVPSQSEVAQITVNVLDVQEAPRVNAAIFALPEFSPNGTVVGTVTAREVDAGQSVTFSIVGGNLTGAFAINPTTGQLTVNDQTLLDFDDNPTFTLRVRATDNGVPPLSHTNDIVVNLSNRDNAPIIFDNTFVIPEFSPNLTVVGNLVAVDVDDEDTLTYQIIGGNTSGAFSINSATGVVRVANSAALDRNVNPQFQLTIQVSDNGGTIRSDTGIMTIDVLPQNNDPMFSQDSYVFTIEEHPDDNTPVGTVPATDADAGQVLTYAITGGNILGGFKINPATGAISVANGNVLDFSRNPVFNLTVSVTDNGLPNKMDTATVRVNLTKFNGPIQMSDQDQLLLELINRARHNPGAEAQRLGLSQAIITELSQIQPGSLQPLAPNQFLNNAAYDHSVDMVTRNFFSHVNPDGHNYDQRAFDAGYDSSILAELIGNAQYPLNFNGTIDAHTNLINQIYRTLLNDTISRRHLFDSRYDETGVGIKNGTLTVGNQTGPTKVATALVGVDNTSLALITGVVFTDALRGNNDDFYSVGEGHSGGMVYAINRANNNVISREIGISGAFSLEVPAGSYDVVVGGVEFGGVSYIVRNVVVGTANVKVDFDLSAAEQLEYDPITGYRTVAGTIWRSSRPSTPNGTWQSVLGGRVTHGVPVESLGLDFNGDGLKDYALLVPNSNVAEGGNWIIGVANTTGGYNFINAGEARVTNVSQIHVGDFNGDGKDDIAALYKDGTKGNWRVNVSNGSTFSRQIWGSYGNYSDVKTTAVGDFNNDGRDDIAIISQSTGTVWVATAQPNRKFSYGLFERGRIDTNVPVSNLLVGNFDGVGGEDIIAVIGDGAPGMVNLLAIRSVGLHFENSNWATWSFGASLDKIVAGDFNGDGRTDVAGIVDGSQLVVGASTGTGFNLSTQRTDASLANYVDVSVGDANGDRRDDIYGRDVTTGDWYRLSQAAGNFSKTMIVHWAVDPGTGGSVWDHVVVGDYDNRSQQRFTKVIADSIVLADNGQSQSGGVGIASLAGRVVISEESAAAPVATTKSSTGSD